MSFGFSTFFEIVFLPATVLVKNNYSKLIFQTKAAGCWTQIEVITVKKKIFN